MSPFRTLAPVLALLLAAGALRADTLDDALLRLRIAPAAGRDDAVKAVLALGPAVPDVAARLRKGFDIEPMAPGWHVLLATDEHGVRRPFQLYVPERRHAKNEPETHGRPPLLVYLHGAVSRPDYSEEPRAVGYGREWTYSADRGGFAIVFPLACRDCVWWRPEGAAAIRAAIREAKRLVPVDDDAVVATGFSDGGSGCYYLAMAEPEPFAAFLPMNGHPAVAASASGAQLYLRNLTLRPMYAAMTRDDALYPAASVLEHLGPALEAGAPIRIASWEEGNHRPVYFEEQRRSFEAFVTGAARRAPDGVDWWCASPATGRAAWVEVLEIGPGEGDAPALPDLNVTSSPGRVRLGVTVDRAFAGPGVLVSGVQEGSPAAAMGMKEGDVIAGMDGAAVAGMEDLAKALGAKAYGDAVSVEVRRKSGDGEGVQGAATLKGRFPAFTPEPYYRRDAPTARLSARFEGGVLHVTSRNVRKARFLLPPDLVPPGPLRIEANGRSFEGEAVALSLEEILRTYARDADGGRVFEKQLTLVLPPE